MTRALQNLCCAVAVLLWCSASLLGQELPPPQAVDDASADVAKALGERRPALRRLMRLSGTWDFKRTDVDVRGEGKSDFRPLSLGNFLVEDLNFGGGNLGVLVHAVYGYDPHHEHYTATWYTSFSTIPFRGTAPQEADTNRFNFKLEHPLLAMRPEEMYYYRITLLAPTRLELRLLVRNQQGKESVVAAFLAEKRESSGNVNSK